MPAGHYRDAEDEGEEEDAEYKLGQRLKVHTSTSNEYNDDLAPLNDDL